MTNWNHISTTTVPIATKLGRMIICLDGLLPVKSHDCLITWSWEITRQNKTTISPLSERLWLPNLAEWWHTLMGSCLQSHITLWSHIVRSCDKLKSVYLHYHSAYGYQTWQDGNLPWWAPAHKVTWLFDRMVL